ncbi:MAG: MMPL family transporter [Planctomycetota bacterium]
MSRIFAALHEFAWHRPRAVVAILSVLSALSVLAILRLRFSSDISQVLPADSPAVDAVQEVMDHFSFTGQMFAFFEKTDPRASDDGAMKLADALGKRLRGQPEVLGADWKLEEESERFFVELVSQRGPLLLPDDDMEKFLQRLERGSIREAVRRNRRRLQRPGIGMADVLVARDPLSLTEDFFLKRLAAGRPGGTMDLSSGYYFNEGRTALVMTIEGKQPPQNVAFSRVLVGRVDRALAEARQEVPESAGWTVSLLGGYPVALQSEIAIKSDLRINLLTSVPPVLLMLLISLRRWSSLAIGAVSLTVGILWTFGLAGLVYGHLTAVTVGFAGLLAGMGIDFTIHMFHRYRHERALGLSPRDASFRTYAGTGPGAFIAMITTAFSILCLWVSGFRGLREFGTLVGVGVLLIFASTFLVIPLFTRLDREQGTPREISRWTVRACWVLFGVYFAWSVQLLSSLGVLIVASCLLLMTKAGTRFTLSFVVGRPVAATALSALLTVLSLAAMSRPPLGLPERETDVKNLRTEGDQILEIEARMRAAFGTGDDPILIVVRGATEDEAMERVEAVTSAVGMLPESQTASIVQFLPPAPTQARQAAKLATIDADRVVADLDRALDAEGFELAAFDDARTWLRGLLAARVPLRPSEVKDPFFLSLRSRFMAFDAAQPVRALVWFTPRSPLQDSAERGRLIAKLRQTAQAASPDAVLSGFSVVLREIDDRIGPDIFWSTLAGGAVSILLAWILYGSFRWMVVSILPAFIGTFWFLGCLKLMGMKMNYLNLIVFPILAGMATDNGLYLVERFREIKRRSCMDTVSSLWPSLTLTSLTTIVGFGSLAFSANRAMKSLGVAISVGMLCYLFASLLVLPPILTWMEAPGEEPPEREAA